jgi:hypothetical protein
MKIPSFGYATTQFQDAMFQDGLHRILRDLPCITSTTDNSDIPTHSSVGAGHAGDEREQGDVYLKLPENGHLASVIGYRELVLDVSWTHTHTKAGAPQLPAPGHIRPAGRPTTQAPRALGGNVEGEGGGEGGGGG